MNREEEINGRKAMTLIKEITALSQAKVWAVAKLEWDVAYVRVRELCEDGEGAYEYGNGQCLCTHWPIKFHCHVRNRLNGKEAVVGNCCVKRFLGRDMSKVFQCVERIKKNINAAPNADLIAYLTKKNQLDQEQVNFLSQTMKNRTTNLWKRRGINCDILRYFEYCEIREANKRKAAAAGETEAAK